MPVADREGDTLQQERLALALLHCQYSASSRQPHPISQRDVRPAGQPHSLTVQNNNHGPSTRFVAKLFVILSSQIIRQLCHKTPPEPSSPFI